MSIFISIPTAQMNPAGRCTSFLFMGVFLTALCAHGQTPSSNSSAKIHSLEVTAKGLSGTQKADVLNQLADEWYYFDQEKAQSVAAEALALSNTLQYTKGRGEALITIGVYQRLVGKRKLAHSSFSMGIALSRQAKNTERVGYGLLQYGQMMMSVGEMDSAALMFQQSYVALRDSLHPKVLSMLYKNLAELYSLKSNLEREEEYLLRSSRICEKLNDPPVVSNSYIELAAYYNKIDQHDLASQYIQKAESLAAGFSHVIYNLKYTKAVILIKRSQYREALMLFNELKEFDRVNGSPQRYTTLLINMGFVLYNLGNYELALTNYYEALTLATENLYLYERAKVLWQIGNVYFSLNQIQMAKGFTKQCMALAEKQLYKDEMATAYNLLGLLYVKQQQYDSARFFYQHSLALRETLGDPVRLAATLINMGDLYENEGKYGIALGYFQRGAELEIKSNYQLGMAWAFLNLGQLHYKLHNFDAAFEYFEKAEHIALERKDKHTLVSIFKEKAALLKATHKSDEALYYFERYLALNDSLTNNTLTLRIAGLQSQAEINSKNQEIALLTKERDLHESQVSQQQTIIVTGIGGVIVLLIALGILYRHNNTVTRLNKSIREQNEEIRSQSEELLASNQMLSNLNAEIERQAKIIQAQAVERYKHIFENALLGIYQSTIDGRFIEVNPAMAAIFGYHSSEEMVSMITDIGTQIYADPAERLWLKNELDQHGKAFGVEIKGLKKNGEIIWLNLSTQLILDADGKVSRFEGAVQDITSRVESEASLDAKNKELAQVNNQMEKFLYSASHDLRSPVSSILGLINLMRFEVTDELTLGYLAKVETSATQLDRIIKDIGDFSKTNYMASKNEKVDFKVLLDKILGRYLVNDLFQKITTDVIIEDKAPFYSDNNRLEIILNNLIRNSINFVDANKTKPFIRILIQTNGENAVVEIFDNGIGIGKMHLENIFKMFYRATEQSKGAGLGLFLVKESIERLNGTVEVDSEIGFGTTFRFVIPNNNKGRLINRKLRLIQDTPG